MDILDNLSQLPEWDDNDFDNKGYESGEAWKNAALRTSAKALYNQWREVMTGIYALLSYAEKNPDMPEGFFEDQKELMIGDAIQIAVKIKTSAEVDMYVLLMENAAVVRKNAIYIQTQLSSMVLMGSIEEEHADAVRLDIEKFRELFIEWIATFKKDEYEDEWNFFV
ncbi:hypothetical protein F0919_13840 [Taibaiella lutea]|uniref:Uncharacterized protein n=1 Tax=Taibaiella lutea TaxID=2608001 RepID=A0A5M6CJT5_9BACT|nr:hypothetical protein [Taibaiella lutea]KAA5533615.1 hypothetical protein F0919_13840 [Taibaiella lutea]